MMDMRLLAAALFSLSVLYAADADLLLYNGKIVTLDSKSSIASAVAIKAGRISRVGTDNQVRGSEAGLEAHSGSRTKQDEPNQQGREGRQCRRSDGDGCTESGGQ